MKISLRIDNVIRIEHLCFHSMVEKFMEGIDFGLTWCSRLKVSDESHANSVVVRLCAANRMFTTHGPTASFQNQTVSADEKVAVNVVEIWWASLTIPLQTLHHQYAFVETVAGLSYCVANHYTLWRRSKIKNVGLRRSRLPHRSRYDVNWRMRDCWFHPCLLIYPNGKARYICVKGVPCYITSRLMRENRSRNDSTKKPLTVDLNKQPRSRITWNKILSFPLHEVRQSIPKQGPDDFSPFAQKVRSEEIKVSW